MESGDIVKENYSLVDPTSNRFHCLYCQKSFAKNVTRMTKHTLKCNVAPLQVKESASLVVAKTIAKRKKSGNNDKENVPFTPTGNLSSREKSFILNTDDTDEAQKVNKIMLLNIFKFIYSLLKLFFFRFVCGDCTQGQCIAITTLHFHQ